LVFEETKLKKVKTGDEKFSEFSELEDNTEVNF